MTQKMRAAIIGCGKITTMVHLPDYHYCPEAEVVGLCDIVPDKAKKLGERWAPDAKIFKDWKLMLQELKPDCVTIAVPNCLHAEITIGVLSAGAHALVEKPMAASLAEAKKMIATAKKHKRLLMVNQSQRRFPPHRKAKEIMDSGMMGKVLHVTAMFGHEGPEHWSPTGKWFFKKKEARFGTMADLGVHKADLVRYLTGKEVAEISAYYTCSEKKNTDVDDNFVSCLKFNDGTLGTLCTSWTAKGCEVNYTILHCEKGTLRICELPGKPVVACMVTPQCQIDFDSPPPITNDADTWGLDVSGAFVRAAMGLEPPFCTAEEGMKALEIVLAAEKSADTGRSVKLSR